MAKKLLQRFLQRELIEQSSTQQHNEAPIVKVPRKELQKQIEMIQLTEKDLEMAKKLAPWIHQSIDTITTKFYEAIGKEPSLMELINKYSSVEALKKTLKIHIQQMFSKNIDEEYIQRRLAIAHKHVEIGLHTKWYIASFHTLNETLLQIAQEHAESTNEFVQMAKTINKLINFEQQLVLEAFEDQIEAIRVKEMEEKRKVQEQVKAAVEELTALSQETAASISHLNDFSSKVLNYAKEGTHISLTTSEQSKLGKEKLLEQNKNMSDMLTYMKEITEYMNELNETSKQIRDVVGIVEEIANRTNLLSLNSSIEAARAGEQGRGFAVVAGEVRKLSEETKHSVSNVNDLIGSTNSQIESVSTSVTEIAQMVQNVSEKTKELEHSFEEIFTSMQSQQKQMALIEEQLNLFKERMDEIDTVSNHISKLTDHLNQIAQQLN
jgi:heam-based aerotactic trancducer